MMQKVIQLKKVSTKIDIYGKQLVFFNDINSSFYNSALSSGMNQMKLCLLLIYLAGILIL